MFLVSFCKTELDNIVCKQKTFPIVVIVNAFFAKLNNICIYLKSIERRTEKAERTASIAALFASTQFIRRRASTANRICKSAIDTRRLPTEVVAGLMSKH